MHLPLRVVVNIFWIKMTLPILIGNEWILLLNIHWRCCCKYISWIAFWINCSPKGSDYQISLQAILKYHFLRKVVMLNCLLWLVFEKQETRFKCCSWKKLILLDCKNKHDSNRKKAGEKQKENRKKQSLISSLPFQFSSSTPACGASLVRRKIFYRTSMSQSLLYLKAQYRLIGLELRDNW